MVGCPDWSYCLKVCGEARIFGTPLMAANTALDEAIRDRLAIEFGELRLVVEEIDLRRRARHVEIDNALGFRGEVQTGVA